MKTLNESIEHTTHWSVVSLYCITISYLSSKEACLVSEYLVIGKYHSWNNKYSKKYVERYTRSISRIQQNHTPPLIIVKLIALPWSNNHDSPK